MAHRFDRQVHSLTVRHVEYGFHGIVRPDVDGVGRAHRGGQRQARGHPVRHGDSGRPDVPGNLQGEEPLGARSDDGHALDEPVQAPVEDMQRVREGFDHAAFEVSHVVRQSETGLRRHGNVVGEGPGMLYADDRTMGADTGASPEALVAPAAGKDRVDRDPVADGQPFRAAAQVHHLAGEFVSHDQRRDSLRALAQKAVQVRTAYARRADLQHGVAGRDPWFFNLLHFHLARSQVHQCLHAFLLMYDRCVS